MSIPEASPDTTVVLILTRATQYLGSWLETYRSHPQFRDSPLVILYDQRAAETVEHSEKQFTSLTTHQMPITSGPEATIAAYRRLFDIIRTPYFCFTPFTARPAHKIAALATEIKHSRARVDTLDLDFDGPLLLHTRYERSTPPRAWLAHVLAGQREMTAALTDYLGYLSLQFGTLSLEGVDPNEQTSGIDLFARVSTGRFNMHEKPPWRYKLAIGGRTTVYSEAPAAISQRVDNQGVRRWENLTATVPLAEVPDGNHLIRVGLDSQFPALRIWRGLTPRPGVLACARTVLTPANPGPETPATRYLIHAVRRVRQTWITVQRGVGTTGRKKWYRTLLRKDVRHILRGRGAGRLRIARLVRLLTAPFMRRRSIWLIGERQDTAQDNGFHLFRHLRENHPDREVYYILDTQSPHYERVAHLGNVVQHSSIKHRYLMLHTSVLANAYSIKHMLPAQWDPTKYTRHIAWRVGAARIYLKHGVNVSANSVKRGTGGYDMYLSVNPRETAALRESSGYTYQIVETGMPRYDALQPGPRTRTILFMPTWRRYLVPKLFGASDSSLINFEGSAYETFLTNFLNSRRLHDMLERYDFRLQFLPHYNLREHLTSFRLSSSRTEMADTERTSFQELITRCDVFLTDHSSVHFDVAYLGTPIIYTHFDREDYQKGHASVSWFVHERDGFGPVTYDLDSTLNALEEILQRDCAPDPEYTARIDAAFSYRDRKNNVRVVAAIDKLLRTVRVNP